MTGSSLNIDTLSIKITASAANASKALRGLAVDAKKVDVGAKQGAVGLTKLQLAMKKVSAARAGIKLTTDSLAMLAMKAYAMQRVARIISTWVQATNAFVENMNLFTVSMGEYADEAVSYAEKVQDAMGIDMSEWIRAQGIFNNLLTGFGVISKEAFLMSQNLTQLGYDISSFYNIQVDTALTKLQSAVAGELEPLRRLGYATDQATLQALAFSFGITKSFNTMTQAEKVTLRYTAIMNQSSKAMGDLGRTIATPANALRILGQQLTQLERALGQVILPLLMEMLPYIQATVLALRDLMYEMSALAGYEIPVIDYSNLTDGAVSTADAMADAEDAIDAAVKAAVGFDELNLLSTGSFGVDENKDDLSFLLSDVPLYDFLTGVNEQVEVLTEKLKEPLKKVLAISGAVLATKIILSTIAALLSPIGLVLIAVASIVAGVYTIYENWDLIKDIMDPWLEDFATGLDFIGGAFADVGDTIYETALTIGEAIISVIDKIEDGIYENWGLLKDIMDPWLEDFATGLDFIGGAFADVGDTIYETALTIGEAIISVIDKIEDGIKRAKDFLGLPTAEQSWGEKITNGDFGKKALDFGKKALDWVGSTTISALGGLGTRTVTPGYAEGGFPTPGMPFIYDENPSSPEYVGKLGGHTTVANQDQIVDGIARGVAVGMADALSKSGNTDKNINVVLKVSGRELARAVNLGNNELGYNTGGLSYV